MFCSVFIVLFNVLDVFNQWGTEVPLALRISALAIPVHAIFTVYYISYGDRSREDFLLGNWFVKAIFKIIVLSYNVALNVLVLNAHIKHEYMLIFCLYMFSSSLYVRLPVDMSVSSTSIVTTASAVWGCRGWTSHPILLVAALLLLMSLKNYLSDYKPSKECSIPKTIVQ